MDQNTGRAKGFAHVQFSDPAGAAKAVELDGTDFGGRSLRVNLAERRQGNNAGPKTPRVESDGTTIFIKVRTVAFRCLCLLAFATAHHRAAATVPTLFRLDCTAAAR